MNNPEAAAMVAAWEASRRQSTIMQHLDGMETEQLALVLLAAIAKLNGLKFDAPLFSQDVSPTARAMVTMEQTGELPTEPSQSKEVSACWEEVYAQQYAFAIGTGDSDRIQHESTRLIFGTDPAELTESQWISRERYAAKLKDSGQDMQAAELLAMQGDRLEFQLPEQERKAKRKRSRVLSSKEWNALRPAPVKHAAYSL